jgi:FAD/FMN-containing dehydrogenase
MPAQVLDDVALEQLAGSTKGEVLTAGKAGYDEARTVFNAMVDKRPAAIVRCKDPADVIAAVEFARLRAAEVSIRSGGHGVTGSQLTDGGVTIDLTAMRRIRVDPAARTARVQAGVTWGELDAATQEHGLAVTGGRVPSTGVAGLTLGSGSGWLERKHGFTCDNLLEADVVTADGRFLRANETENADLFWALKGGGGNFGVVTQFTYRLHPVGPEIYAGMLIWPGFMAADVARSYRDFMAVAPDEVGGAMAFLTAPPEPFVPEEARGKPVVGVIATYAGDVREGEGVLAPLRTIAGGPAVDLFQPMPYLGAQQLIAGGNQPGYRQYWKADLADELADEAIDAVAAMAPSVPSPLTTLLFQPLGGAIARVPSDATAMRRRDAGWAWHLLSQWPDAEGDAANLGWTRELAAKLAPYSSGGVYINYTSDTGEERVRDAYGPLYDRLVAIKDRYDPANMFRLGQNIRPSAEAAARAERP